MNRCRCRPGHAVLAHSCSLLAHQPQPEADVDAALEAIRRALRLAPDDALVHHCHAAVLGNLGRTEDGIRAWKRALELNPNNAGARAGLGIAQIYAKKPEQAGSELGNEGLDQPIQVGDLVVERENPTS